jgi:hypothetical protein
LLGWILDMKWYNNIKKCFWNFIKVLRNTYEIRAILIHFYEMKKRLKCDVPQFINIPDDNILFVSGRDIIH